MNQHAPASAVVLAGGRSQRMGRNKALLRFGAESLIERVVAELKRAFEEVVIVLAPAALSDPAMPVLDATAVWDDLAFGGPVEALRNGISAARNQLVFACSCDLPLLRGEVAQALCDMIAEHEAVIPMVAGRLQPLHAVYQRQCVRALSEMAQRGERRLGAIAEMLDARIVGEHDLRPLDPEFLSFFNLNTEQDYARALQLAAKRASHG